MLDRLLLMLLSLTKMSLLILLVNACSNKNLKMAEADLSQYFSAEDKFVLSEQEKYTMIDINPTQLNETIKRELDTYVAEAKGSKFDKKYRAIKKLLNFDRQTHFAYDGSRTKTAIETYNDQAGNCLSLANLTIAAANYLGLHAKFQLVDAPLGWEVQNSNEIIYTHINVRIRNGEFLSPRKQQKMDAKILLPLYSSSPKDVEIDFVSSRSLKLFKKQLLKLNQGNAYFFSNRGVEFLLAKEYSKAYWSFKKALQLDPTMGEVWSNLGILYHDVGEVELAKQSLLLAENFRQSQYVAAINLIGVYHQLGQHELAEKYKQKSSYLLNKDPYHFIRLANQQIKQQQFYLAIDNIDKAIALKGDEAAFYFLMAKAFYLHGDKKQAEKYLTQAVEYADKQEGEVYQNKLNVLRKVNQSVAIR